MRCSQSDKNASSHLDRQLAENEAIDYLAHVEACADCRTYLAELEQVSLILRRVARPDAPQGLRNRVMSEVTAATGGVTQICPPGIGQLAARARSG
jgi:anti-sigma factor RsiW